MLKFNLLRHSGEKSFFKTFQLVFIHEAFRKLNHIHLRMHSRREKEFKEGGTFKEGRGIRGGKLQKSAQTDRQK